jgi:hypothetical protein
MDYKQFDNLIRSVASGAGTRRQARRALGEALLAGALGGVATQLGLAGVMGAKQKRLADHRPTQCRDGEWPCPDGSCVSVGDCCPGMKRCGVSSCIPKDRCCPGDDAAGCQPCEVEVCVNGAWVCQPTDECGPRCGDG